MKEKPISELQSFQSSLIQTPLVPYLKEFVSFFFEQGYTESTIRRKQWVIGKFNQWLSEQTLRIMELNEQRMDQFIEFEKVKGATRRGDRATLRLLLQHLKNLHIIPSLPENTENNLLDQIEQNFVQYLSQERGLSQATLIRYPAMVRRFLKWYFNRGSTQMETLKATDIANFMLSYAPMVKRSTAKLMATCLRSFFRFLWVRGIINTDLAQFVPTVADWRMSDIPKFLKHEEVMLLLDHCDQKSKAGQRDYAILLLLARLGLRAGEIAKMKLDDINWESGELLIRGKGPQTDRLPLLHDIGNALATYLQKSRPFCSTRLVFVRIRAPHQGFSSSVAVCNLVQRALLRANLHPVNRGAHLLRHSLVLIARLSRS